MRAWSSKLGIRTHLHAMRHYSATELLASGVDLRTVAGRLGHGSGGATTLKVYAAWVARADQQASELLAARLPNPRPGFDQVRSVTPGLDFSLGAPVRPHALELRKVSRVSPRGPVVQASGPSETALG